MCRACSSAAARAAAEGLSVQFQEADAEALDFGDATFDTVLSTFGVMFTPDQDRAASELLRVCKSGGKIGLANWTPDGFIGQLFKTLGKYLPPPAGAKSPALWGTQARITEMFGTSAASIKARSVTSPSATARRCTFSTCSGITTARRWKAFAALDELNQRRLADDMPKLIASMNRAEDGTMVLAVSIWKSSSSSVTKSAVRRWPLSRPPPVGGVHEGASEMIYQTPGLIDYGRPARPDRCARAGLMQHRRGLAASHGSLAGPVPLRDHQPVGIWRYRRTPRRR